MTKSKFPLEFKGFQWKRLDDGSVEKLLLRIYTGTKQALRQSVCTIDADLPFCALCITNDVTADVVTGLVKCNICGCTEEPPQLEEATC